MQQTCCIYWPCVIVWIFCIIDKKKKTLINFNYTNLQNLYVINYVYIFVTFSPDIDNKINQSTHHSHISLFKLIVRARWFPSHIVRDHRTCDDSIWSWRPYKLVSCPNPNTRMRMHRFKSAHSKLHTRLICSEREWSTCDHCVNDALCTSKFCYILMLASTSNWAPSPKPEGTLGNLLVNTLGLGRMMDCIDSAAVIVV